MNQAEKNIVLAEKMYAYGIAGNWPNLEAILTDDFEMRGDQISRIVPYFLDTARMAEFLDRRG